MLEWKRCAACSREYPAHGPTALYCSRRCRESTRLRRPGRRRPATERTCAECRAVFAGVAAHARYCSPACRIKASNRRNYAARRDRGLVLRWVPAA
jgi:hypothetical protein